MSEVFYLIGRTDSSDPYYWNRPMAVLHVGGDTGLRLSFADGVCPHDGGATRSVRELAAHPLHRPELKMTQTTWLLPFVERWERGETVDSQAVLARYHELHGRPAEQATSVFGFQSIERERE
jgi:hypothetical protein